MTGVERPTVETIDLGDGHRIAGFVDEGFGPVLDTFRANFLERGDLGAACAVYHDGRLVVDLWGGIADRRTGRPWDHDTTVVIFSCTKGILAILAYLLVQDGVLDLNAPIARYWPSFAAHGKESITLRQVMSHRAGLPCLDRDLTRAEVLAWNPVIRAIEDQRPIARPADGHIYHALTYGWLVGEVLRRITGRTPGQLLRERLADRLGLRTWIGIPLEVRPSVAWTEPPLPDEPSEAARATARIAAENPIVVRSVTMGAAFGFPVEGGVVSFNDPAIQAVEIPGANGISTATSLARLYAWCVTSMGDAPPLLTATSISDALRVQSAGPQLTGQPDDGSRWGTGFQLASPPSQPMLGAASFGHAGAGGQLAFADADWRVGFAYLTNQMGGYGDRRARTLTAALRTVLGA